MLLNRYNKSSKKYVVILNYGCEKACKYVETSLL